MITLTFVFFLACGTLHAGGDAAAGEELASMDCIDCHGEDGKGGDGTPALAGMDEAYLVEQLKAYKSGERTDEGGLMAMTVEELSEQDMANLAAYYATLEK
ncbi:MAG: cytochrome c [Xanthomonadales bacterium]|nr:cytochrome c [Gammaproteobacteria bacterium]MBT8052451.1 cytochrome c [Gammaproteobacteria bacterium]NND57175.1 cytochrome c [Xanthomonadales bacterium]NNK52825.1 cytochrome c [Xanthomonadales bacterium]